MAKENEPRLVCILVTFFSFDHIYVQFPDGSMATTIERATALACKLHG